MSLLDKASLIVTPNGFKASKLYSVIPSTGAGDMDVTRATTATRVNSLGLIESVANNVPRLDYLNSACPSLLVEQQRTNVFAYSNSFILNWGDDGTTTRTPNSGISPDGTQNATKIVGAGYGYRVTPALFSGNWTFSLYLKASTTSTIKLAFNDVGGSGVSEKFITVTTNWQRFDLSKNITLGTFVVIDYSQLQAGVDYYFYEAQLEAGSYATSLIPTQASSVTRNADVIGKTGITSLIGQTEGTLFYDGIYGNELNEVYLFLQKEISTGVDDSIYIQQTAARIALNVYFGSTQQVFIADGAFAIGQRIKIAASYKNNDFVLYVNGVQIGADNIGSVPTCGYLQFASYRGAPTTSNFIANKGCKISALWKTRLSNTELATLTTL